MYTIYETGDRLLAAVGIWVSPSDASCGRCASAWVTVTDRAFACEMGLQAGEFDLVDRLQMPVELALACDSAYQTIPRFGKSHVGQRDAS